MKLVFLAGIHGVGKSHLAGIASQELDVLAVTASSLIRHRRSESWTAEKVVQDSDANQRILVDSVLNLRSQRRPILLDGHFVLRSEEGIFRVPVAIFQDMKVDAVILLEHRIEAIESRLAQRGVSIPRTVLVELAKAEREHAFHVCQIMNIEPIVLSEATQEDFLQAMQTEILTEF